jgi:hypothetical protein
METIHWKTNQEYGGSEFRMVVVLNFYLDSFFVERGWHSLMVTDANSREESISV